MSMLHSSFPAPLNMVSPHDATAVLVAYVDTYFGKRLFYQFRHNNNDNNNNSSNKSGKRYKLFACTWEKESAIKLSEEEKEEQEEAAMRQDVNNSLNNTHNTNNTTSPTSVSAANFPVSTTNPIAEESRDLPNEDTTNMNTPNTNTLIVDNNNTSDNETCFFWRGDTMAMRQAILEADYIVMELRQAQDVFDMMHILTTKELLKPKRVIVISSLLTWFATPPLNIESTNEQNNDNHQIHINDNDDNNYNEEDEEGEDAQLEHEEEPQPPDWREVEQLLGPPDNSINNNMTTMENDNPNNEENNDVNIEDIEVFTEDQYNRRVPHVKYYNWREAERVVAAGHSEERRLYTCVIFAGLSYGDGEDILAPLFSQVWSRAPRGLPLYGTGAQIVPTIHIRDLVTFTRRLLEVEETPIPRYTFAVDAGNITWRRMVQAMNRAFGGERTFHVPPEEFVLHHNVEYFTMNMRVDNQTMREIMPADEDWVAQGGFVECMEKVAYEFVETHKLQPVRVVILGPPLAGKTSAAAALAERHYQIPTFTIEKVVEEYKAHINMLKEKLENFRNYLYEREKSRREEAKKRAFLRPRRKGDENNNDEDEEENNNNNDSDEQQQQEKSGVFDGDATSDINVKKLHNVGEGNDDDMEDKNFDFKLTEEERQDVETLVEEWYQQNDRVIQLRETINAMERVLSMKARVQLPAASDVQSTGNPKKKKELNKSKRSSKTTSKKAANSNEEEEPNIELQENAPFLDKALAIMMRWRLSRADCRNQGYIIDGFPETVAQARLIFDDSSLDIPETIEEAVTASGVSAATTISPAGVSDVNIPPPTIEPCEESRLPSFVFVLEASDNYLLDRLTTLSKTTSNEINPLNEEKRLARFEEAMTIYKRQFIDTDYSLPNFFECARTVAKTLIPGGRAAKVTFIKVDTEPLLMPPPPESPFALAPATNVVSKLCKYIGEPHNFGPTPLQQFEEVRREHNLKEEKRQKELQLIMEQRDRERQEYIRESNARSESENAVRAIELADRAALEERKAPLWMYLQRNIVPLLSKGLVEVCRNRPEDPVDFLAEWLTRHNPVDDSCFDL